MGKASLAQLRLMGGKESGNKYYIGNDLQVCETRALEKGSPRILNIDMYIDMGIDMGHGGGQNGKVGLNFRSMSTGCRGSPWGYLYFI